jgi:hypothetical protein
MTNDAHERGEERDRDDRHDRHDPDADRSREIDEWIEEITRRPWFVALESLPGEDGLWVGTEDELMTELEARTQLGASQPGDFPLNIGELIEPEREVEYAFRKARLDVMDYRKTEKEFRDHYDAPGWGRKQPILLRRGHAGLKPSLEGTLYGLKRYGNPLAASIVLFTHSREFRRNKREWSGSTVKLAERLRGYPVMINGDIEHAEEIRKVLELESREDFRRFFAMMKTCAYILRDEGVKVSWERYPGFPGSGQSSTLWTIEAPNWRR